MRYSSEPLYTISADSVLINTIKSSANGRIFMGGKDGCLYEFYYQNQSGWFSSQTKRINLSHSKLYYFVPSFLNFNEVDSILQIEIDESRNILFTRSENNCIQVFYLGAQGTEAERVAILNSATIANKAASLVDTNDKHIFMPIVHISAITKTESTNLGLMAITQFGIRLYFSLNPFDRSNETPSTVQLVHVRLAPNIDLGVQNRTGPIMTAFSRNGTTLMISKRDEKNDTVLLLNNDLYLLHSQFKESKSIFNIDGRIWCMDEIETVNKFNAHIYDNQGFQQGSASNNTDCIKLSSHLFDPQRRFVMITPQGCFMWNKLRPIDQMCYALLENNGPNSDLVRLFFKMLYSRSEACALCLAVALSRLTVDTRMSEWATQAYFIYGGEAEIRKRSLIQPQQGFNSTPALNKNPVNINDNTFAVNQGDVTQIYQQRPGQFGKGHFTNMPGLQSPQLMSTPIIVRTKEPMQQQQSIQQQHNFVQQNVEFGVNSEYELIFSGTILFFCHFFPTIKSLLANQL
jgi:nuclear pore complex protein Nup155